jgi:alkylation response protein AidB-like acyl-CoA dehydrogenase
MTGSARAEAVAPLTREPLPLPGQGDTLSRFEALATVGAVDLCVAKLVEPHHDACAILAELGGPADRDRLLAVWAAEPPHARLRAERSASGWLLSGSKAFCSGAAMVTHALVTAGADDGDRLFLVDVGAGLDSGTIELAPEDWVGDGMRRAGTRSLRVHDAPAEPVGAPGEYVDRPGFWHGAVGVAACWLGGARAVASLLEGRSGGNELDPHRAAHLGAVTSLLDAATAQLHAVARSIDLDPGDEHRMARRDAQSVRATVVACAEGVMTHTAHALGPAPLAFDAGHAQRVSDLQVFIRQHHGERDLAELGRLVAGTGPP